MLGDPARVDETFVFARRRKNIYSTEYLTFVCIKCGVLLCIFICIYCSLGIHEPDKDNIRQMKHFSFAVSLIFPKSLQYWLLLLLFVVALNVI